ncbi:MAG: hypothetical protein ACI8QZ_003993 [Chlamydiales bacterium]|jgi:hypothetical protein
MGVAGGRGVQGWRDTRVAGSVLLMLSGLSCMACGEPEPTEMGSQGSIDSVPLARAVASTGTLFQRIDPGDSGIDFRNDFDWEHERHDLFIHGYAGGGVCIGDYDGDGRPDIYLLGQLGQDRLYRQVGDLRFEDVSAAAGLVRDDAWGTGAVFADVDNDGRLDLYVCNYDAPNRLYMNAGDGSFREEAAARGVAFDGASVMASLADYDCDGDLDLYLLTNRMYTAEGRSPKTVQVNGKAQLAPGEEDVFALQERNIAGEVQKFVVKAGQPDRLYRNDGQGRFTEVAAGAGISGNHPGLSATWWDYDRDGYPDLYVCNDFWDADRLYHNEGDGTFRDVLAQALPRTPWFSMGSDFGDLNGDGRFDFVAADMSPTTHYMSKIMMGEMGDSRWFLESAEPRQYMRNAVYLNTGSERFMEVAYLTGLANTDWTWSIKLGDLDNDGRLDLFAANGTANHSFDADLTSDLERLRRSQAQRRVADPAVRAQEYWRTYHQVPPRAEHNLAYRNEGELEFSERSQAWGLDHLGISFGASLADLDRDGDLDLVVSNIGDTTSIYRNGQGAGRGLLLRLVGVASNRFGVGATVELRAGGATQVRQLSPTRGYMSANEPLLHFGLGSAEHVDELVVEWPSGHRQRFVALETGRFYTITEPAGAVDRDRTAHDNAPDSTSVHPEPPLRDVAAEWGLVADASAEQPFDDYARQPLLPAKHSRSGPGLALGDADGDGDEDLFMGGSAGRAGALFLRVGPGRFERKGGGPWSADAAHEDTAILWLDVDGDGDQDLFVASGSVECDAGDVLLRDRLYLNDGAGAFVAAPERLPAHMDSTGAAAAADWDGDGDLDLFVGGRVVPGRFPETPVSHLLRNDEGAFVDVTAEAAPELAHTGMVTCALFSDADGDGRLDLLVAHEWGPIRFFQGTGAGFEQRTSEVGLGARLGWWSGLAPGDFDGDGDIDYAILNAGLNTKYEASESHPAQLFAGDFDGDGSAELVEAKAGDDGLLPVRGLSCSVGAMPHLRGKLPTFRAFASASLDEIYEPIQLERSQVLSANHLESGMLINQGGAGGNLRFEYRSLPRLAQAAPGFGAAAIDLDCDGQLDLALAQNFSWREPETGRWDGGLGLLLRGVGAGRLAPMITGESGFSVPGDGRALVVGDLNEDGRPDVLVAENDGPLRAFRNGFDDMPGLSVRLSAPGPNPTCVGARVTLLGADATRRTAEIYAGSGYLSQSSAELFFAKPPGPLTLLVRWPDGSESRHPVEPGASQLRIGK